jgi:hypothetical protein
MRKDWSTSEVEAVVDDYLEMLVAELEGRSYNKAAHNRALQDRLNNRSKNSIEFKHQNISAALYDLGYPCIIEGYKPKRNYQELLGRVIGQKLKQRPDLDRLVASIVARTESGPPVVPDILGIAVDAPEPDPTDTVDGDRLLRDTGVARRVDFLEREARNRSLGEAGEELVLRYEHERLWRAGHKALADRIEHVSRTQGDGLGYDVLSFGERGEPRLIEVKTTRFGKMTPFYASRNEIVVSAEQSDCYHLYRVFSFGPQPRLFILPGSLHQSCNLEPIQYRASVR